MSETTATTGAPAGRAIPAPHVSTPPTRPSSAVPDLSICVIGEEGSGTAAIPLVDRSCLEDTWRPDEYACVTTRGYKGKPLDVYVYDPKLGSEWTTQQRSLYDKVERLMASNRLVRVAQAGSDRQYLLIRLQLEKTTEKLRQVCR